jgi:hypothetical protein
LDTDNDSHQPDNPHRVIHADAPFSRSRAEDNQHFAIADPAAGACRLFALSR